jgi:hypothetical protein
MFRSLINATTTPDDGHDGDTNLAESSQQGDNLSFLTGPMVIVQSETQEASTTSQATTFDHSRLEAYRENLSNSLALDQSLASDPTKKMVGTQDIMISDGSLTYDNIDIVDPEEQQQQAQRQAQQAAIQHLEQVARITSTLQDMEESLCYLVKALDLEEQHESLKSHVIIAAPPQADDDSSSQITSTLQGMGKSLGYLVEALDLEEQADDYDDSSRITSTLQDMGESLGYLVEALDLEEQHKSLKSQAIIAAALQADDDDDDSSRITSTLQDMGESLGYLVEALDLEEQHESLKSQAIMAPPQADDDDSSLSLHASEMTTSLEGLGGSISTTMSTGDEIVVEQESPHWTTRPETTFNEPVLANVNLPVVEQHGLDVLIHVGNQLSMLQGTTTASPTSLPPPIPMPHRSNNKKWIWIASLFLVVLCISIFCHSFQSVVVHQDVLPPTEGRAFDKNSSLFILMDEAPKEHQILVVSKESTNLKEQIDPAILQDKTGSTWITAALGFLVMWMAIPKKRSCSVVVTDDCREEETNACHNADSTTKNNNEGVKQETSSLTWDFSAYEKLRVAELRTKLESRRCSTVGRKHILIQRLVDVYSAELETLTVKQLRPVLKSKECKQAGLKAELIQRLVEAGMQD